MGIEYHLVKLKNGHAYELGKPGARTPEDGWMEKLESMNLQTPCSERMQVTDPSSAIRQIRLMTLSANSEKNLIQSLGCKNSSQVNSPQPSYP